MTDIEQLDKCISWHFVAGTISREARDAWNRILAERSADKARIAAAERACLALREFASRQTTAAPGSYWRGKSAGAQDACIVYESALNSQPAANSSATQQGKCTCEFGVCKKQIGAICRIHTNEDATQPIASESGEQVEVVDEIESVAQQLDYAAQVLCSGDNPAIPHYAHGVGFDELAKRLRGSGAKRRVVLESDYDALRAEHAAIAADLLATAQRYHERAIAAERKLDAYRVAVREMFLMVERYNNFNPAAAWLSARVAEIIGGAKT